MAIIVEERDVHKKRYILIGAGYGLWKRDSARLLDWADSGDSLVVAASDKEGNIKWFKSESLRVVSVDGENPSELLSKK